jgi:hypothetical protein
MSDNKVKRPFWKTALFIMSMLLMLAVIFIPIIDKNFKSTLKPELKNFAVEEPDKVTRIFLASKSNTNSFVDLEKNDKGVWMVNGQFPAEERRVKGMLNDYLSRLAVKNPVPAEGKDNVLRSMAANAIKVEIYKGTKKDKVFYVGGNTADELATYMLLENSSMPFAVHIPGFQGYPGAVFTLNPKKWRTTNIFQTSIVDMQSVEVMYPSDSKASFRIDKMDRTLQITPLFKENELPSNRLDQTFLKQYTATFESLTYEDIFERLALKLADSVVGSSVPYVTVVVTKTDGTKNKLDIYKKPVTVESPQIDNYGNPAQYDLNRFYGVLNGNRTDILSIQSYVFKTILKGYPDFFK